MCYHSNSCRSIIISSKRWERVDGKSFSSLSAAQFRAQHHQSVKLEHHKEKNLCAPKWWKLKLEQLQGWSTEGSKDNNVFPSFSYFVLSLIRGSHMVRITTLQGATWTPHSLLSCLHCPQDDTEITLGRSLEPQTGQKASLSSPIKVSHVTLDDPIDSKVETGGLTSWMWLWDTCIRTPFVCVSSWCKQPDWTIRQGETGHRHTHWRRVCWCPLINSGQINRSSIDQQ